MSLPLRDYFQLLERYLRPQGRLVGLLAFCIFAGIGFQLWLPQIVRSFLDIAQQGAATSVLMQTGVLYLVVTLVNQAVRLGAAYQDLCVSARRQISWFMGLPVFVAAVSSFFFQPRSSLFKSKAASKNASTSATGAAPTRPATRCSTSTCTSTAGSTRPTRPTSRGPPSSPGPGTRRC